MATHSQFNYRGISVVSDTFKSTGTVLCERCHNPTCSDFAALECKDYQSALKFIPPLRGFDNKTFNTFRLGTAWSKRVRVGSNVALVNSKTGEAFAQAKVTRVVVGAKELMAITHGKFNHTMQALNVKDNIAETMLKRLKNTSGSRVFDNNMMATVIYLERVD